jgi:hypothetical protein
MNKLRVRIDCLRDIFTSPPNRFTSLPDGVKLLPQLYEHLVEFDLRVALNLQGNLRAPAPRRLPGGPWGRASTGIDRCGIKLNTSSCSSAGSLPFGAALRDFGLVEIVDHSDQIRTGGGIDFSFAGRFGRGCGLVFDAGMMTTCKCNPLVYEYGKTEYLPPFVQLFLSFQHTLHEYPVGPVQMGSLALVQAAQRCKND